MTTSPQTHRILGVVGIAGIGLLTLAGCSTAADAANNASDAQSNSSSSSPSSDSSSDSGTTDSSTDSSGDSSYSDGTYTAEGSYVSPAGEESVKVEITLASGTVTAVTVTPEATDPQAKGFQQKFASGIAAEVVGKSIDSLNVSRVAGSSLTSGGFNEAIDAIKEQASA
ncbi:MAG: hypothetical protein DI534_05055 [Leifsonia xyli]|nr:MAG: hypothetical protein DI534_05055 [Leifsonia xyli]